MAKIKYDVTDVEAGQKRALPSLGVHVVKLEKAEHRCDDTGFPGKDDIKLTMSIVGGTDEGFWLYSYISLGPASRWKLREFTDAIGLEPAGELDLDKLEGKKFKTMVNADSYQGEATVKAGRFYSLEEEGGEEADDGAVDEAEPAEVDEGEDYTTWTTEDLKEEMETRGLKVEGRSSDKKMISALTVDDAANEDPEPEAEPAVENENYPEWSLDELVAEMEARDLEEPEIQGRKTDAKKKAVIIDALRADDKENPI